MFVSFRLGRIVRYSLCSPVRVTNNELNFVECGRTKFRLRRTVRCSLCSLFIVHYVNRRTGEPNGRTCETNYNEWTILFALRRIRRSGYLVRPFFIHQFGSLVPLLVVLCSLRERANGRVKNNEQ